MALLLTFSLVPISSFATDLDEGDAEISDMQSGSDMDGDAIDDSEPVKEVKKPVAKVKKPKQAKRHKKVSKAKHKHKKKKKKKVKDL